MTKHCKDNEGIFSFGAQSSNTLMSGSALGFSQTGNNGAVCWINSDVVVDANLQKQKHHNCLS